MVLVSPEHPSQVNAGEAGVGALLLPFTKLLPLGIAAGLGLLLVK